MNTCTICRHPDRDAIDRALLAGQAIRSIQARFTTEKGEPGRMALQRHKTGCMPELLAKAHKAEEVARADDLLEQLKGLRNKAVGLLMKAEAAGDYRTALAGVREARGCLELLAELEGQLQRNPQINILIAPEWVSVRAAILEDLQPFPTARVAVAGRLLS
jgi:hypothetical protein